MISYTAEKSSKHIKEGKERGDKLRIMMSKN